MARHPNNFKLKSKKWKRQLRPLKDLHEILTDEIYMYGFLASNFILFRRRDFKNTFGRISKKFHEFSAKYFFSLWSRKWRRAKIQLINKRMFQNNGSTCHRDFPGFSIEPIDNRKIWLSNRWQQLMICRCNCNKYVHIISRQHHRWARGVAGIYFLT